MENLANPAVIRRLMEKYGLRVSKKLGQNFIVNHTVCPRIAELGGAAPGVGAIEIGPGLGVLTTELAKRCDKVVAIELDSRLLPLLEETLAGFDNVKVLNADVLKVDLGGLIAEEFPGMEVIVCANLPYYITSPILMTLLEDRLPVRAITVMVQREAAQRICAPIPSRQMGAITVAIAWHSEPKVLFEVSPGSFYPPPDVHSAVIRLDLKESPPFSLDEALFFRVVRAAFSQRRKTILNSLCAAFPLGKPEMEALFRDAAVNHSARAEQLSLTEFAAITRILSTRYPHFPA